jgi:hypothetical protein
MLQFEAIETGCKTATLFIKDCNKALWVEINRKIDSLFWVKTLQKPWAANFYNRKVLL